MDGWHHSSFDFGKRFFFFKLLRFIICFFLTTETMRFALIGFLVLLISAAVKAHVHFIRLALLAAMGLAGMYMMHKLAQDWHKISTHNRPAAMAGKLLGLWKRSIPEVVSGFLNFLKFCKNLDCASMNRVNLKFHLLLPT